VEKVMLMHELTLRWFKQMKLASFLGIDRSREPLNELHND
jgi:hypothetical protein